jgi:hypothetical protein
MSLVVGMSVQSEEGGGKTLRMSGPVIPLLLP